MVTAKQVIEMLKNPLYKPIGSEELMRKLQVSGEDKAEFVSLLNQLEAEGEVVQTRGGKFGLPKHYNMVVGKLQGSAKGFGFVLPKTEEINDVYIHGSDTNGAIDGDTVLVRLNKPRKGDRRPEGIIIDVLKRGREKIVGRFKASSPLFGVVIPEESRLNVDIFVPSEKQLHAQDGQIVVVRIVPKASDKFTIEGEIIEILGDKDAPGIDILSIIRKHGLPEQFPAAVEQEAELVPDRISEDEIKHRRDLRERVMVTIDGEDAKDLDDAVSVERLPNGNVRLGVHIADVSYYVKEGSALDREAYERGCSVYLVDRVIPMLPKRLSNGICSLNPKVDRLTMTCDMEINSEGHVVDHDIYASVICTNERMTYGDVKKIVIDEDRELISKYKHLVDDFRLMASLADTLRKKRMNRGAIDFNFSEAKILVDEHGKPTDIVKRPRTAAEQLIEEFMLAANETVAEHFYRLEVPFVYRIHENPDPEKLLSFYELVNNFGYNVKGKADKVKPRALQSLLGRVEGSPEEMVISTILLRSMKQAKYSTESVGHFGLAATFYSHFTSPIRRYPDLLIHRVIREVLEHGHISLERVEHLQAYLTDAAQQSSIRERVAVDAERETNALKMAEYMKSHVGEEFEGVISSITNFGIFVELPNTVEGLIHVSNLTDDYYNFHERAYLLIGERTKHIFRMGDPIKIRVSGASLEERKVDFELVEHITQHELDESFFHREKSKTKRAKPGERDRGDRRRGKSQGKRKSRTDSKSPTGNRGAKSKRSEKRSSNSKKGRISTTSPDQSFASKGPKKDSRRKKKR
ncbi:ribonuclease R [Thermoactinomyces sp. DSM 45892]|uniref:ribonuclease R n=1 Tax=Thermoactinomyces sp. DSM 45892 TaxID=1882753 RepID=UPI00089588F0|nr:ribonuclease R [Thermoactinomyces sp. DSM 45892]SDY11091.1 ribonuclease R [Thermoactinomyces sp. DSM 45892]